LTPDIEDIWQMLESMSNIQPTPNPQLPCGPVFRRIPGQARSFAESGDHTAVFVDYHRQALSVLGLVFVIAGGIMLLLGIGTIVLLRTADLKLLSGTMAQVLAVVAASAGVLLTAGGICCCLMSRGKAILWRVNGAIRVHIGSNVLEFPKDQVAGVQFVALPARHQGRTEGDGAWGPGAPPRRDARPDRAGQTGQVQSVQSELHLVLTDGRRIAMDITRTQPFAALLANLLAYVLRVTVECVPPD
jgi:hypothetical protein